MMSGNRPFYSIVYMYPLSCSSMDEEQLNPVDLNLINDLWVPNVFIYNLKTFKVGTHLSSQACCSSISHHSDVGSRDTV